MPIGWLHTGMMPSMCEFMKQNKTGKLCAYSKQHQSPCADRLVQTTDKKIQTTWCATPPPYLFFCFINSLCSVYKHYDYIPSQTVANMTMNNSSNNRNGGSMYNLCLIKWLSSKACESEFNHLWWQYGNSVTCDKRTNYKWGRNRKRTMTSDNIQPNQRLTYMKLAHLKT